MYVCMYSILMDRLTYADERHRSLMLTNRVFSFSLCTITLTFCLFRKGRTGTAQLMASVWFAKRIDHRFLSYIDVRR